MTEVKRRNASINYLNVLYNNMGFFRKFLRRVGKIGQGIARGVQEATGAVAGTLSKLQNLKDSPVGRIAMMALMANPKTRGVAMKVNEAIDRGVDLSSLANRVSKGEMDAINEAVERASRGQIMGTA